uniref:Reticulocalbin-3 n=1 Tax=Plectus sambesii TaxID=2011161 RepID=A0A914W1Y2_9BILA
MRSSMILLAVCLVVVTTVQGGAPGQREQEVHGARSPSEKFRDEHYKDGVHKDDLDHQAILGSKHEAEEFDHLAPLESKKRLRLLAAKMDADGDGFVSKQELTNWIHKSMLALDQEETEERFSDVDENKDDRVSWEEYAHDAFGDDDEENKLSSDPEDVKLMEEDRSYFKAADKDNDGTLDRLEFSAFQNPEHHEHMHETLIEVTLKEKDTNKNGQIEFKEFMGDVGDNRESEWYNVEKERFEKDYDKNKDGVLDRSEMRAWLIPDTMQTSVEEMEHLFNQADNDKDGRLSYDEITDEYRLFVGSEATNYGEHLDTMRDEL